MTATWTFGPSGIYTATWDGVSAMTVTVTATGAFIESFSGQSIGSLAAAMAGLTLPPLAPQVPGVVATTGTGGFALTNGTGTIMSWTAPADGRLHNATWSLIQQVTSAETGGVVVTGISGKYTIGNSFVGGSTTGWSSSGTTVAVLPGDTFVINQATALTAGAATVYGTILGA